MCCDVAELDLLPEHGSVLPEPRLPDVVADDDDRRRGFALIVGREKPSEQRRHARHPEPAGTHRRHPHGFRQPIARLHRRGDGSKRADLDDGLHLIAPGHEIVQRLTVLVVLRDVPVLERDDAVAFVERQRGSKNRVEEAEHAGRDRDADGDADAGDRLSARDS